MRRNNLSKMDFKKTENTVSILPPDELLSKCNSVLPQLYLDFTYRLLWQIHCNMEFSRTCDYQKNLSQRTYGIPKKNIVLFNSSLHKIIVEKMNKLSEIFEVYCKMPYSGGRKATPTNISIFDFNDVKTLWFEFGNYIFTGFKMSTL